MMYDRRIRSVVVPGWVTRGAIRAARGRAPYVGFAAALFFLAGALA